MLYLPVNEMFSSIQGEGPYVGVRQIFLRLPGCNLSCPYCDTIVDQLPRSSMEVIPGSRTFQYYDNPLELKFLLNLLLKFNFVKHHSLSLTGGEPLLWNKELAQFIPLIREKGLKIYLETNGTLPDRLDSLLPLLDIISMDIKLPFNGHVFWNEHYSFLNKSNQVKKVFVKIVLYNTSQFSDIKTARELIADIDPDIPTILQPVTAVRETVPPKQRQMLEWQDYFLESLKNVRIIPQTHVLQGQL